jgi:TP901 family phage tail tape measure protein
VSFDLAELVVRVRGDKIRSVNTDLRRLELQGGKTERSTQKLTKATTLMAAKYLAAGTAVAALSAALVSAVRTHMNFERAMSNVGSVAGATAQEMKRLSDAAREQARVSVFSAQEAADAQYYLASAGMSVNEIISAQKGVMDLAAATQSELAFTAEAVASAISQFGLEAKDSTRIANVYAAAISGSQANMEKLADSMRYAGPVASQLGQSIEGTTAQLMALYNGGLRGEQAGTALRASMLRLLDPTKGMTEALAEMNVNLEDGTGKTRPFMDVISELASKNMDAGQATKIFGQEASAAMLILAKNIDKVKEYEQQITGTSKATQMAKEQTNNLWGDVKSLGNAVEEIAHTIGSGLNPGVRSLVQELTKTVDKTTQLVGLAGDTDLWRLLNWSGGVAVTIFAALAKGVGDTVEMLLRLGKLLEHGLSIGAWIDDPDAMQKKVDENMAAIERLMLTGSSVLDEMDKLNDAMAQNERIMSGPGNTTGGALGAIIPEITEFRAEIEKLHSVSFGPDEVLFDPDGDGAKSAKELAKLQAKMIKDALKWSKDYQRIHGDVANTVSGYAGDSTKEYSRAIKTRDALDKKWATERLKAERDAQDLFAQLTDDNTQIYRREYQERLTQLNNAKAEEYLTVDQYNRAKAGP